MFAFNLKDIIELYSFQKINSLLCFSLWQSTVGLMKSYMLSDMDRPNKKDYPLEGVDVVYVH